MIKFLLPIPIILLTSCNTLAPSPEDIVPLSPKVESTVETISESTGKIFEASDKIYTAVQLKHLEKVKSANGEIQKQKTILAPAIDDLKAYNPEIKLLESSRENLIKELADRDEMLKHYQEESTAWFLRCLQILMLLGTVTVAFAIFAFFTGNSKAIGLAIAGVSLIIAATMVTILTKLTTLFVILAALTILSVVGVVSYEVYLHFRNYRALRETVTGAEKIKAEIPADIKSKIFGDYGIMSAAQSTDTKEVVKDIRKTIIK